MNLIIPTAKGAPMKTIQMRTKSEAKANLTRRPEETHTKDELAALHNAIHFTHQFMHAESMEKLDIDFERFGFK
jgi:hypothetical protein